MMVRAPLPGKSLTIGSGAVRDNQQMTRSSDVHLVHGGTADSGGATSEGLRQTVSILGIAPTSPQPPSEVSGATVFVGAGNAIGTAKSSSANSPSTCRRTSIPEVRTVNGYGTKQQQLHGTPVLGQRHQQQQPQQQSAHHVVKIRINPELDTGRVISTVRLTPDQEGTPLNSRNSIGKLIIENTGPTIDSDASSNDCLHAGRDDVARVSARNIANDRANATDSCVRISVSNVKDNDISDRQSHHRGATIESPKLQDQQRDEMVQQRCTGDGINASPLNRTTACFYYGSFQNQLTSMVMSSGQCSPSDTLDSGTCSDLDGTPPPLPKKKNSSTVLLGVSDNGIIGQHNRTGSLTSSGAEVDSDDNESNISCDSLNSGELAARIVEQQSARLNGSTTAIIADDKRPQDKSHVTDENAVKVPTIGDEENGEHTGNELQSYNINNNNNNSNDNIKNNNNNNKVGEVTNGNGTGEALMNERNNGNGKMASETTSELISGSCSTTGTSPSVSPSPSGASSLSKASSTPRVRSPVTDVSNGRVASPVVKECTYEERKREQDRIEEETAAADYYANYNRKNGTKYLYDDDRFYKFHVNEHQRDDDDGEAKGAGEEKESDEFFAGYKILDREAIRSAKGTVRGVKNRVRAGIATFLQKPSTKVCIFLFFRFFLPVLYRPSTS